MPQSRDSRGISLHGHRSDDSDNSDTSDNPENPLSPLNSPPRASSSPPTSLASSVDKYDEDTAGMLIDSITYSLYGYAAMVAPVTAAMVLSRYVRILIGNWTSLKQQGSRASRGATQTTLRPPPFLTSITQPSMRLASLVAVPTPVSQQFTSTPRPTQRLRPPPSPPSTRSTRLTTATTAGTPSSWRRAW